MPIRPPLPYSPRIKGKNKRQKGKIPTSPCVSLRIPVCPPTPFCLFRREKEKIQGKMESVFWGFRGDFCACLPCCPPLPLPCPCLPLCLCPPCRAVPVALRCVCCPSPARVLLCLLCCAPAPVPKDNQGGNPCLFRREKKKKRKKGKFRRICGDFGGFQGIS